MSTDWANDMDVRSADTLIGQTLGGYEIQRRLGEGGMAVVYVAHQPSMQRDVAIKVMRHKIGVGEPTFFSRFEREARTIAGLEHAHILPVIDFGQANGHAYLVMRLADDNLANIIKTETLSLDEIARMLAQVADALDYAHERGVIHRDLKPGNILLDKQRNCYLADFGIARLMNVGPPITTPGMIIGTPGYMSPEQIRGESLTGASDRYSLGVTLYEMVCGQLPYSGETPRLVMTDPPRTPPLPPRPCRPDLPLTCQAVLDRALADLPAERYPTARALASAFGSAVAKPEHQPERQPEPEPVVRHDQENIPTIIVAPVEHPAVPARSHLADRLRRFAGQFRRPMQFVLAGLLITALLVGGWQIVSQRQRAAAADFNEVGVNALAKLDYNAAIENFKEAIRLDPTYAAAYYNLGVAYEELGNTTDAQSAYQTALKYDDHLLFAAYRLAELLLDAKDLTTGFQVADNAMRILQIGSLPLDDDTRKRLSFYLYATRGRAYQMRGTATDLALAEHDLQQALVFKDAVPYPAPAYYYLALVSDALGNKEAARQAWLDMLATYDQNNARQREWAAQAEAATAGSN